jgi:outer membrane protein assembly factor BamB
MKHAALVCCLLWSCRVAVLCAEDWLQFRGNTGQGHAQARNLPLTWSETENIAWKVPLPGLGWSSPTIQGDQLWLTTGVDDGRSLRALCVHVKTGRLVHDVEVFARNEPGQIHAKNSHASPTPVIDGSRVYVHFGAYGTGCVSTDGRVLWTTQEMKFDHRHGPGGSPVVFEDLLIVPCDGIDVQFMVALNKYTGQLVWKTERLHVREARKRGEDTGGMAFSTPLLIEVGGRPQLVCTAADHVAAYDPRTGQELWWSAYEGYSLVPRPVYGHGMVYVCSGYNRPLVYAVRVGGRGEVTRSHVAWTLERGAPLNPSPLLVGNELYLVSDAGIATCVDAHTGRIHWQQRLGGNFSASPLYADGRIYLLDERGTCTVIQPGRQFRQLARNQVDGRTLASLAVADGALFLRTDTHLYRIERRR